MKSIITLFAFLFSTGLAAQTSQTLFDDGWTFSQDGKTISVNLPHDWDIYTAPNPESGATGTGGGWYAAGKGEYRKKFATPKGEIVKLHFEGVYQKAEVFVNGQKAGQHGYGYTPFTIDVTPYLFKGKRQNEVVVKVNNSEQPNCRWYSGSGIYRHVWLETMPALHISENGVFVTTPKIEANKATVNVEVTVQNEGNSEQQSIVEVEGQQKTVLLKAGESKKVDFSYTISNPHLWSPDDPYLYTANVKLSTLSSQLSTKYGIRSFSFDAEKGFMLNGKPMVLNGACVHHDDGVLGSMAFDAAEIRKVKLMKEAGFNLIRTSHNPTTRAFLDACDSIGMLVIGEAFDGWRTAKLKYDYSTLIDSCYREDIHAMVMRDRNHPSIISWSLGNEVIERKELRVVHTARLLKKAVLEIDDTRPITEALCAWDRDWEIYDPHFEVLDIGGYNYMIFKHGSDHQRDPKRVMWQTESYPRDAFRNWATVNDHPYVVGDMVWTGLDYLGESGIGRYYYEGERPGESFAEGGQPDWHGAYCGDVDITGWRKPISHYREMLWDVKGQWSKANGLYMAVKEPNGYRGNIKETMWSVWPTWESWNWTGSTDYKGEAVPSWEGKPIDVEVYTKAPKVKLYLNDKLVGTKQVSRDTQFKAVFSIPYEVGVLRAEADGKSVTLATAGEPARLRLTADRNVIAAGGQDLAYITVEVVDKDGRVCPDAAIPCEAVVKGQGQLMAFASADLKDREPKTSSRVTTWKGRALLVVRSSKTKGKAQINIKSSLPTATLTIISK
ncbi:glycoside hydrolase family 2 TIM barrel-domain containing protein [Segatella albensis]|uniref:glycoside hydrolase family 2 TIM barrel-domain containing protein n=2 Tax=Segatella albensis TaxID=77768 RepID=UPI00041B4901|nr:glycoside hydrolase family 2 TIM barrel-domain containing protein [Segatella albensis]